MIIKKNDQLEMIVQESGLLSIPRKCSFFLFLKAKFNNQMMMSFSALKLRLTNPTISFFTEAFQVVLFS